MATSTHLPIFSPLPPEFEYPIDPSSSLVKPKPIRNRVEGWKRNEVDQFFISGESISSDAGYFGDISTLNSFQSTFIMGRSRDMERNEWHPKSLRHEGNCARFGIESRSSESFPESDKLCASTDSSPVGKQPLCLSPSRNKSDLSRDIWMAFRRDLAIGKVSSNTLSGACP